MSENSANLELKKLLKTTFVLTFISASFDNDESKVDGEKIGGYVAEAIGQEILENSISNAFSGEEEFDFESVMNEVIHEMDKDSEKVSEECEKNFDNYTKSIQTNILSAVYQALLMDDNFSTEESAFFNELLSKYKISMDEVNEKIKQNREGMSFLNDLGDL
jgi:hypothetical protein